MTLSRVLLFTTPQTIFGEIKPYRLAEGPIDPPSVGGLACNSTCASIETAKCWWLLKINFAVSTSIDTTCMP